MPSLTLPSKIPYGLHDFARSHGTSQSPPGASPGLRSDPLTSKDLLYGCEPGESEESPRGMLQGEYSALAVLSWLESQAQAQQPAEGIRPGSSPAADSLPPGSEISPRAGQTGLTAGRVGTGHAQMPSFGGCAVPRAVHAAGGAAAHPRGQLAAQSSQQAGKGQQHAEEADTPKLFSGPEVSAPVLGQGRPGARRETIGML